MHHAKDILVSTIIPTYNKHHYLKEALFSVLNQAHENQQIIIVNDFPDIDSREYINTLKNEDKRIQVIHNATNRGVSVSRNKGIALAKGKYVAFLDDDDKWHQPNKLSMQIEYLQHNPKTTALGTQYTMIDTQGHRIQDNMLPQSDRDIRKIINFQMPILQSSLMTTRDALQKVGGYNPNLKVTEDYELIVKLGQIGKLHNLPDYMTSYRINEGLTSSLGKHMASNGLGVLLERGLSYPKFARAVLYKLFLVTTKETIKKACTPEQLLVLKKMRDKLLSQKLSQSYNHIDSQDEA